MRINRPQEIYKLRFVLDEPTGQIAVIARDHQDQHRSETIWSEPKVYFVLSSRYANEVVEDCMRQLKCEGALDIEWRFCRRDLEHIGGFDNDELEPKGYN